MRKSRASLEAGMTPPMFDAEREITFAWSCRAGHMGYGSNDLLRVRGVSERDQDMERGAIRRFTEWMNKCPIRYRQIVIDIAIYQAPVTELAIRHGIAERTVVRRFHRGLTEHCKLGGIRMETRKTTSQLTRWLHLS